MLSSCLVAGLGAKGALTCNQAGKQRLVACLVITGIFTSISIRLNDAAAAAWLGRRSDLFA